MTYPPRRNSCVSSGERFPTTGCRFLIVQKSNKSDLRVLIKPNQIMGSPIATLSGSDFWTIDTTPPKLKCHLTIAPLENRISSSTRSSLGGSIVRFRVSVLDLFSGLLTPTKSRWFTIPILTISKCSLRPLPSWGFLRSFLGRQLLCWTLPETNIAPENRPPKKEISIPTIIDFEGIC